MARPTAITDLVRKHKTDQVREWVSEFSRFCFEHCVETDPFPDSVFREVVQLMSQSYLYEWNDAHVVLLLFEYDWGRLTASQRSDLLPVLVQCYPRLTDIAAKTLVSEILGHLYANREALAALVELSESANEVDRALACVGLRFFATHPFADLQKVANRRLDCMKDDHSDVVTCEARLALFLSQRDERSVNKTPAP
jgi:hypothetical protein